MKHVSIILSLLLLAATSVSARNISGRVTNTEGEPIIGASLVTNVSGIGTTTDTNGAYALTVDSTITRITFSSVGYQSRQFRIDAIPAVVVLERIYYRQDPIIVTADRAQSGITPIAFDNVSADEIQRDYTVGELPLLLQSTPNVYTYTDGGSSLGYSYISIRGFNDKRIATYINGVPLNDPEDQATYFVDLPDFAANITDIQVQRGVGNSLYGDASFGGSVNIVTTSFNRQQQVTLLSGYGAYTSNGDVISDIYKQSIEYSSGLINGRWVFGGRFSKQKTGGYRDHSWYQGWAYYFSLARIDPNMTTQLFVYGGPMRMHLAYWGASLEDIAQNRRVNPLTYSNETDNFNQPHYHLHNLYRISDKITLANTLYYIRGKGYYEQLKHLKEPADFFEYDLDTAQMVLDTAALVRQQWVYKSQYGWNPRLDIEHSKGKHSIGGSFYYFESNHWGQVVWVEGLIDSARRGPDYRYYQYFGKKWVGSLYTQEYYHLSSSLTLQATAQMRYQRYKFDQVRMGAFHGYHYDIDWLFFSPRLGITYSVNQHLSLFANSAVSSRTPTDAALYDANDPYVLPSLEVKSVNVDSTVFVFGDPTAKSERVYDFELGGQYSARRFALGLNLFWMRFENEIIPYGGLTDEGVAVTINADRSVHAGIELSGKVQPSEILTLDGNLSFNYNRIKQFQPDIDGFVIDFADKTVPGFPDYVGNLVVDVQNDNWRVTLRNRFMGRQYMELNNIDSLAIDPFYTASLSVSYRLNNFLNLGNLTLSGSIDNLFDKQYLSSGYGGNYAYDAGQGKPVVGGWAEYYVASERSFYTQVKLEMF